MNGPKTEFEKQLVQIAALGVWQIVTGHPMKKRLEPVQDPRWNEKSGIFVTLRTNGQIRGSMGLFESSTTLAETAFNVGQTAATHDSRFAPIQENEIPHLDLEVALLSEATRLAGPHQLKLGEMGVMISRGEKRGVLLPHVAVEQKWNGEQFLEACCEKAGLSHKAWKDANTLVESFSCHVIQGGNLLKNIEQFI